MIYVIIFLVLAALSLLDLVKIQKELKPVLFWIAVLGIIFISSIRWETGPDWSSYAYFFNDIDLYINTPGLNMIEPGYTFINKFVSSFTDNYTVLIAILALLTIGIKAKVFYRHSEIMMICLFLYYCYYLADIASVRQFLAISLTMYSIRYIEKKSFLLFSFITILAASIHISSLLFFLAYPLYHVRYSNYTMLVCLGLAFIAGITNLAEIIINQFISSIGFDTLAVEKILKYGEQGIESANNPYQAFILGVLKRIVVLPVFIFATPIINEQFQKRYCGYLNLLVFGNIIYFIFAISIPVITRLSTYFLIYELFLWGYLLISVKDLKLKFLMFMLLILFGAFRLYTFIGTYRDLYVPFQTIFQHNYIDRY